MSRGLGALARHDSERLSGRAWLAQLTSEIRERDAREGLLLPPDEKEGQGSAVPPPKGLLWLQGIATRTLRAKTSQPAAFNEAGSPTSPMESDALANPSTRGDFVAAPETGALTTAPTESAETTIIEEQLQRARQLARDGDLDSALTVYADFLPAGPGLEQCAEDLAALARVQPRDAKIHQILGDVQCALGRLRAACNSYQRALAALTADAA